MKVEVHPPDEPDTVVATVTWTRGAAAVEAEDPGIEDALVRVFRATPVVVDDASYRRLGTHGEVLVQPGDVGWFLAVAQTRLPEETGLAARFVPEGRGGGFDPAAGYRTFESTVERLVSD